MIINKNMNDKGILYTLTVNHYEYECICLALLALDGCDNRDKAGCRAANLIRHIETFEHTNPDCFSKQRIEEHMKNPDDFGW